MNLNKKLLSMIVAALLVLAAAGLVYGAVSYPGSDVRPTFGTVLTSTAVNYSSVITEVGTSRDTFNITLYNTSNADKTNYSVLYSGVVSNATFWNQTITMKDSVRHYWYINYTNASGAGSHQVSPIYIFNVDSAYNRLPIGSATLNVNFTMYHGSTALSCGPGGPGGGPMNCTPI